MRVKKSKTKDSEYEQISIWQTNEGDLVCYPSSQKIYIVAEKNDKYVLMVSATQQFKAAYSFDVKRVLKAEDVNEENYSKLFTELTSDKNVPFKELLKISNEYKQTGIVNKMYEAIPEIKEITPKTEKIDYKYDLPNGWDSDLWFDRILNKEFRTEKEVETQFILPLSMD